MQLYPQKRWPYLLIYAYLGSYVRFHACPPSRFGNKVQPSHGEQSHKRMTQSRDLNDLLQPLPFPEVVIGLVGPIGVDLKAALRMIDKSLSKMGYKIYYLKVTDTLPSLTLGVPLQDKPLEERYRTYGLSL
jgi:hypothetical protein